MDIKPRAPTQRLVATLLAVFVIWIVNGEEAPGSIVVFATEGHVLPTSFTIVNDISNQIEPPARRSKDSIVVLLGYGHYGHCLRRKAGARVNSRISHAIEAVAIWRDRGKRILSENINGGVALDDRSGRDADIGDHELDLAKLANIPFVEADTTHDEVGAESEGYVSFGKVDASNSSINSGLRENCLATCRISQNDGERRQNYSRDRSEVVPHLVDKIKDSNDERYAAIGGAIILIGVLVGIWAVWVVASTPSRTDSLKSDKKQDQYRTN
jgi:hypothetical protein